MMAVQLHGGLGNQLFQLAFGEWLAARQKVFYYCVMPGKSHGPMTRSLQVGSFARARKRKCLSHPVAYQVARLLNQRYVKRLAGNQLAIIDLTRAAEWPEIPAALTQASDARLALLTGYFQFSDVVAAAKIHKDPYFRQLVRQRLPEVGSIGQSPDLVADCLIHVRVGDYKQYGFPICDHGYFTAALRKLAEHGFAGRVFVVSDDPASARDILQGIHSHILAVDDPLEVLSLVSAFKYKIISNSTLSLWGALFGDSASCVFPTVWPANSREFTSIGNAEGWTLVQSCHG